MGDSYSFVASYLSVAFQCRGAIHQVAAFEDSAFPKPFPQLESSPHQVYLLFLLAEIGEKSHLCGYFRGFGEPDGAYAQVLGA